MHKKTTIGITIFIVLLVIFIIVYQLNGRDIEPRKQCSSDQDCVPATCCHPTDAVNREFAPNCHGVFCTEVCEPNTIDCGQGEIKCIDNICQAVLNN